MYRDANGSLVELRDATAPDFIAQHSDPSQPVRLYASKRSPDTEDHREQFSMLIAPTMKQRADQRSARSTTVSAVTPSQKKSKGVEFLGVVNGPSPMEQGRSVIADLSSDVSHVLEYSRMKMSDTFAAGKHRLSAEVADVQRAWQESSQLQAAQQLSKAEARARLSKVMDVYGVRLRPVEADGNCQFRALSVQLFGDESQHGALRGQVIEHLRRRRNRYEGYILGTYEEYLERMSRSGEWGDNVSLQAVSDVYNCEIKVLTDRLGSDLLELRPEATVPVPCLGKTLCLAFTAEVHYDAVIIPDFRF